MSRASRPWVVVAGMIVALLATAVAAPFAHLDRELVAGIAIYVAGIALVPLAVVRWRRIYAGVATLTILVGLFLALWGLWPALPVVVALLASLFAPVTRLDRDEVRRLAVAVIGALALLGLFTLLVVPGPKELVACGSESGMQEVFDVIEEPVVEGVGGAPGGGTLVELDDWASDDEVDALARRIEAIGGIERTGRESTACR